MMGSETDLAWLLEIGISIVVLVVVQAYYDHFPKMMTFNPITQ